MSPSPPPVARNGPSLAERIRSAPIIWALTAINVAVFLYVEMHGGTTNAATLLRYGAVESDHVWSGQYWRLATYMFLHIGWVHLLWNSYASFGWCTQVERELGHVRFLIVYLLSGLAGGVASTILPYGVSAGASGAMFGIIGATLALRRRQLPSFAAAWEDRPTRATLMNIGLWTVIGLTALPMNNRAHFGGLIGGAIVTWVMTAAPPRRTALALAWSSVFAVALVAATRPWQRGRALPDAESGDAQDRAKDDQLMAQCERGVLAACHAFAITQPEYVGDTTRDLEGLCELHEQDACAAWGWTLAHGRPGVKKDEARGLAFLRDACAKGSTWGCELMAGKTPLEALASASSRPAPAPSDVPSAPAEPVRVPSADAFFGRIVAALHSGKSARSRAGTFYLEVFRAYEGRDPRTGAAVPVPPKKVIHFVASDELSTAALSTRRGETFAEADARFRADSAEAKSKILPSVDVPCSDEELGAVARALATLVPADSELELPRLGVLTLRKHVDEQRWFIVFQASDEARAARGDP